MKRFLQLTQWNKLLSFLLLFVFTACEKSAEEIPTFDIHEEPSCLLTEEVIESNSFDTIKNRLQYVGPQKQIVYLWLSQFNHTINNFEPVQTESYTKITYDTRGNIVKAEATGNFQGDIKAMQVFEYNDNNQLITWRYYWQFEGKLEEVHVYTFEYASPTQLKKLTRSSPWFGTHEASYNLYEYRNGLMYKVLHYEQDYTTQKFRLSHTTSLEYDDKKHPKRKGYALHIPYNYDLLGFPYQHNITKSIITVPNDPKTYVDYTATYTYNEAGFPITQQKLQGEIWINHTYTYQCK